MTRRKCFVMMLAAMVCMPVGMFMPGSGAYAKPVQDETATAPVYIYGWINETGTGNPVQAAVYFADMDGYGASNSTVSSPVTGYYSIYLDVTNLHTFLMHGINTAYKVNKTYVYVDESWPTFRMDMLLEPAPPRDSFIKGYLLDAVTGVPLSNQSLTAASDDYLNTTTTNATGFYSMGFIPGDYTMGAGYSGYESTTMFFSLSGNQTIWRNITLEPLNCTLKGFLSGAGGPMDNAYVYVEEPWNVNPYDDDYSYYTDGTGYYEFNLTRGTKNVGFRQDGYFATSRPKTLVAGVNWLNVTLAVTPTSDCTIMGYVRDFSTGAPINNSNVRVGSLNNSWNNGTTADITGYYEMDVISGDMRMQADYWNWGAEYYSNGTKLTLLPGQSVWQNFTLTNNSDAHASLRGNITFDGTAPFWSRITGRTFSETFRTGADGSGYFEMFFPPGYIDISAMAQNADGEQSNIESFGLVLQPGEVYWYDFSLHSLSYDSIILGSVEDQGGQPVEGTICYFSNGDDGESTYTTAAISDFQGTYEITAPTGEPLTYMLLNPNYRMVTGTLDPDTEWNWNNFTLGFLGSKATLKGYIRDLEMNPVTGHEMTASADNWMNWTTTDSSGYYEVDVPAGDVYLNTQMESSGYYEPGTFSLPAQAGKITWLNVTVRPRSLLHEFMGRVSESGNASIAGSTVTAKYSAMEFTAVTDAGGNFTMTLPDGYCSVSARKDGYGYADYGNTYMPYWSGTNVRQNLTLDQKNAWIELPASDYAVDLDSDGKFDRLSVNVTVNVSVSGDYSLEGDLYSDYWLTDSDGGMFGAGSVNTGNSAYLTAGVHILRLDFSGPQVNFIGQPGFVVELDLYDGSAGWQNTDRQYYFTTPYNNTDFDVPDVADADPPHSFGPIDTDFDGLYNLLQFNTTVEILAPGNYTFISQLYNVPYGNDRDMGELDQTMITRSMTPGIQTLEFAFSGTDIYNSGRHLGLASTMMFNGSGDLDQSAIIWTSQCYVPYNYTKFQNYPLDSIVYGWANDTGNAPIADLRVEIFNMTSGYADRTFTDASGYYELWGWEGDWLLVMNDDDDTAQRYQGNLTQISLAAGNPVKENRMLQDEILDENSMKLIFAADDWNKTTVDQRLNILVDNQTIRYEFDMYEFGNGDGFISESEVDLLMGFLGSQIQMPANLTDHMNVDGVQYNMQNGSVLYDIGLVGEVTVDDPVYIHQKANYTASVPVSASHELYLNVSYDNVNTGSMSEANTTSIYYVYPPTNWGRTGNNATPNVVFQGTDIIIIDPLADPNTGDSNESEWTNVTIDNTVTTTYGSIAGNVTLDGRTSHFGVAIKVMNVTSGLAVANGETDINGRYFIPGVPQFGPYNITASKEGYAPVTSENRPVIPGQTTWFTDITLHSDPPSISNIKYETSISMLDQTTVYADVKDDGEVGPVTLMYNNVNGTDIALPMAKLGSYTYKAVIPVQGLPGTIDFYIMANDTLGNSARYPIATNFTITVLPEAIPPTMTDLVISPEPTEYGDPTNISVRVTDSSGIAGVWLQNLTGGTNTTMDTDGAGNYWMNTTSFGVGLFNFTIWADDIYGNTAHMDGNFTVQDTIVPQITGLSAAPSVLEFNGFVNISATVTDLAGVTVTLRILDPLGTELSNSTMTWSPGDVFYFNASYADLGQYDFILWATDAHGNVNSLSGIFTVQDSVLPVIANVLVNPAVPEFGDTVNISATATDLAGMGSVWLRILYPNGTLMENSTMTAGASDAYYHEFDCSAVGEYDFTIWAYDLHGVSASSSGTFWMNDTVLPTIANLTVPATVEFGESVNITADVTDNSGMKNVTIQMFGPTGAELFNNTMKKGSYWYSFTPDEPGTYNFTIWAIDENGVANTTKSSFTALDTVPPEFQSVAVVPQVQEVFGNVAVRAVTDDLDSVSSCYLNLTAPDGTWLSNTSMSLTGNIWVLNRTYSLLGVYHFTLWARDPSGNFNSTSGEITTEDTHAPVANAGIDRTVPMGTTVTFNASASTDNYGIANYTWTLTDNGVQTLYGMEASYTFTTIGVYDVLLTVTDHAGLTSTDTKVITVTGVVTTGSVTGTVLDADGVPIAGVTVYVKDSVPRIEDVTDNTGSFILENVPQGAQTIVFVHDDYTRQEVQVTVVAGGSVSTGDITLSLSGDGTPCIIGMFILIIVGAVIMFYIFKKRKAKAVADATVIDEIFFISSDGRLIKHFTRRLKPDMDQDILSGMLVAVQDFIKDSFRGEEGGLEELKFGKFQIVLGRGKFTIIAALILGDDTKPFRPQIEKCLRDIETNHENSLKEWNGDVETLTPTFRHINDLIDGKYA